MGNKKVMIIGVLLMLVVNLQAEGLFPELGITIGDSFKKAIKKYPSLKLGKSLWTAHLVKSWHGIKYNTFGIEQKDGIVVEIIIIASRVTMMDVSITLEKMIKKYGDPTYSTASFTKWSRDGIDYRLSASKKSMFLSESKKR